MNQLFENEKQELTNNYEARLRELEHKMSKEYEQMRMQLQKQIDDLTQ